MTFSSEVKFVLLYCVSVYSLNLWSICVDVFACGLQEVCCLREQCDVDVVRMLTRYIFLKV